MYLKRNIFLKNNISIILMRYKTINKNLIIKKEYTIEVINLALISSPNSASIFFCLLLKSFTLFFLISSENCFCSLLK